jgi:hypothetical protein
MFMQREFPSSIRDKEEIESSPFAERRLIRMAMKPIANSRESYEVA